jgi:serine/threonine protein kinase/tetratricopeptide (TPR) repeat protein
MYRTLNEFVDAYEEAQSGDESVDLDQFLPPRDHPLFEPVFRELIRVELEYGWRRGRPRSLDDYRQLYPGLLERPDVLKEVAFEEYRLRQQLGQTVTPEMYAQRYGVATADWPGPHGLQIPDCRLQNEKHGTATPSPASSNLQSAICNLQSAGGTLFLGFELMHELGQGAFGRVYLARQGEMANRLVVLKISSDADRECQTLAQLVHTHIVPVYSFHRSPPYQAACMPYLGATTLAHVLEQLGRQSEPPRSGKDLVSTIENRTHAMFLSGYSRLPPTVRRASGPALPDLPAPPDAESPSNGVGLRVIRGSTATLAMLEGLSFVDAVLWLGSCLADGLAHAHERGIVHRDIKPANILLTDEGLPMLLDFNLADSAKPHVATGPDGSRLGGTLAYMAPEHLEAFQGHTRIIDARSDLYSLGIILFQLLSRRQPFRAGLRHGQVDEMVAERRQGPPRLRSFNRQIPPALEAIVHKCLEPNPAGRYQDAHQLHEDLERQRHNRPLRHAGNPSLWERCVKWYHRNPRLAGGLAVSLVAAMLLAVVLPMLVSRGRQVAEAAALEARAAFTDDFRQAQYNAYTQGDNRDLLEEGCRQARRCLDQFGVLERPDWQQRAPWIHLPAEARPALQEDIAEALLLLARGESRLAETRRAESQADAWRSALNLARQAGEYFDESTAPSLVWKLQAELLERLGQDAEARQMQDRAGKTPARTPRALYLDGADLAALQQYANAIPLLEQAVHQETDLFAAWFALGFCHWNLGHTEEAIAAYSGAIALRPNFSRTWLRRGQVRLQRHEAELAERDFGEAIRLEPTLAEAYVNRALTHRQKALLEKKEAARKRMLEQAVADLTTALEHKTAHTRVYFMRAGFRKLLGDRAGAKADRRKGLALTPNDENSFVARGMARLEDDDEEGALADFEAALKRNPWCYAALSNKAYIRAEKQGKPAEAIAILDRAIQRYPDHLDLRGGRAVYHARLGHRKEAVADIEFCLLRDTSARRLYQMASAHALLSRGKDHDHREALRLLAAALHKGFDQFSVIEDDPDLANLRRYPECRRLLNAARALAATPDPASHQ